MDEASESLFQAQPVTQTSIYSVSKSSSSPFFAIFFTRDEPVQLKVFLVVAQPSPYVSANSGPFIRIFALIVSLLLVRV